MRTIFILLSMLVCFLFSSNPGFAQKAKFKSFKAVCQKTVLPQNYVEPEDRTYSIFTKGDYASNIQEGTRGIYGWQVDHTNPNLEAVISVYGFRIGSPRSRSENKQTKDKDGKVTARWTEYTYSGEAEGKATLYVYGQNNPFVYQKLEEEKSKSQLRREAEEKKKQEEKEKALAANPFLSSEDVANAEDAGESNISEDSGLDNAQLPLVKTVRLDVSQNVNTRAHRSSSAAWNEYKETQRPKLYDFRDIFPTQVYNKALNTLNTEYGYSPVNYNVWLKSMRTEKHPEFKMWNDACQAAEALFKPVRFNKSIAEVQMKFEPIIGYFRNHVEQIPEEDKKGKALRKAAFENLTNILFYLDQHDQVLALCEKHLESKTLGRVAKKMKNKSNHQAAFLAFHKLETCHLESLITSDGDIASSGEEEEEDEDEDEE